MSSHHNIQQIQIYIFPVDLRSLLEERPEIKKQESVKY